MSLTPSPIFDPHLLAAAPSPVCVVAIVRDELPFLDEWLAYHRLLGIGHFVLYDDDPALPLREFTQPHRDYVTVVDWYGKSGTLPGRNRQTKAYVHSLDGVRSRFKWVAFIDIDEFIVLRQHDTLPSFLAGFENCGAVALCWHVFGHNGYFKDPPGLVTATLTRRMAHPGNRCKSISKVAAIADIRSAHRCALHPGFGITVDANGRPFSDALYPGKSEVACVNHYACRSFEHWMGRPKRGSVIDDVMHLYPENRWKSEPEGCLQHFVEFIAKEANEYVDEFMLRFKKPIEDYLAGRGIIGPRKSL
jgi:hypothetical protein